MALREMGDLSLTQASGGPLGHLVFAMLCIIAQLLSTGDVICEDLSSFGFEGGLPIIPRYRPNPTSEVVR